MRDTKDSNVAWIGNVPAHWEIRRGKTILTLLERPVESDDGVITCFRDGEVTLRSNRREEGFTFSFQEAGYQGIEPGDLVVHGMDGFAGAIGISDSRGKATPVLNVLDSTQNKRFLMYYLRSMAYNGVFLSLSTGIRVRSCDTNWNKLKNLPYIVPSIQEQNRIADFLDRECHEIDFLINRTKDSLGEYKRMRQAVISQAVTRGIRGDRPMKASGIKWAQQIPSEWHSITPKAMFTQRKDKATKGERQLTASQQHGVIYQDEYMALTGSKVVTVEKDFDILKHVEAGDFVISMRSFQGGLEYSTKTGSISSAYVMLIPNLEMVEPRFFRWLFKSSVYINALQSTSNMVRDGQAMRYSNFAQVRLYTVPLDEQREIADYLDQKCAEIDDLIAKKEQFLVELENYKKALIYEYVTGKKEVPAEQPTTTSIVYPYFPAALNTDKRRFAQAILMCRILDKCRKKMGRVKLEKMLYTIESSIGFDLETEYVREAAGPLDASIYECERIISKRNKWYTLKSSSYGVSYVPTKDSGKYEKYYDKYFASYDAEIDRIINIFMNYDADQAEIVATLFAAWNDFIIDQRQFSDEELVDEVLNNWNDSKKRFSRDVWLRAIDQMRKNNIIPSGYGKRTVVKN